MNSGTEAGNSFANVLLVMHENLQNANTLFSLLSGVLFASFYSQAENLLKIWF